MVSLLLGSARSRAAFGIKNHSIKTRGMAPWFLLWVVEQLAYLYSRRSQNRDRAVQAMTFGDSSETSVITGLADGSVETLNLTTGTTNQMIASLCTKFVGVSNLLQDSFKF